MIVIVCDECGVGIADYAEVDMIPAGYGSGHHYCNDCSPAHIRYPAKKISKKALRLLSLGGGVAMRNKTKKYLWIYSILSFLRGENKNDKF